MQALSPPRLSGLAGLLSQRPPSLRELVNRGKEPVPMRQFLQGGDSTCDLRMLSLPNKTTDSFRFSTVQNRERSDQAGPSDKFLADTEDEV